MAHVSEETEPTEETQVRSIDEIEESLEPVTLIEQSRVTLRVGRMMLAAGTASYRVKQAMADVSAALGVHEHSNHVSLTSSSPLWRGEIIPVPLEGSRRKNPTRPPLSPLPTDHLPHTFPTAITHRHHTIHHHRTINPVVKEPHHHGM